MPEIILKVAASGTEIAKLSAEPLELVARLRSAAAAYGGAPELRCGLRLMFGTRVLRDCDTLEASGLAGGGSVDVVKVPSLEFWREGKVVWNSISVPASGPLLMGLTVRQLARDRLLAFPAMPAWRKYLEGDDAKAPECGGILSGCFPPAPALEDHQGGKYVVQHFEPSDVWLVGASEQSALDISVQTDRGYVSARRIPLPLADPHQAIHAFEYQDEVATVLLAPGRSGDAMEELQDGLLQKYRLHGLAEEDLSKLRFEPEGGPSPFKFKFPSVADEYDDYYKSVMKKFNWQEGDQSAGRLGERVDEEGLASNTLDDYTAGRDRCGEVVARLPEGWQYGEEVFDFEVCQLAGGEPKQLAKWRAEGHVNNHCQCLGDRLMLFAGSHSGEDAFYEEMQLIDWQTQEVIRQIPLDFGPHYIESEWDRGILNGSTQTFFTNFPSDCSGVETETEGSTTFVFGTPEM
ncbi:unnamed protein product [Symbiodinium sp. CCMP2456]|nr:unnamed protein product [Symbiodinium sp. CCMP2456]